MPSRWCRLGGFSENFGSWFSNPGLNGSNIGPKIATSAKKPNRKTPIFARSGMLRQMLTYLASLVRARGSNSTMIMSISRLAMSTANVITRKSACISGKSLAPTAWTRL